MSEPNPSDKKEPRRPRRLYRSEKDRLIGGVAGGMGEFFGLDSTIIRVLFVLLALGGGAGILMYLILWIVIPSESSTSRFSQEQIRENIDDMKQRAGHFTKRFRKQSNNDDNSAFVWGVLIIGLGFLFLLNNYGFLRWVDLGKLWPFILIILGFSILTRK